MGLPDTYKPIFRIRHIPIITLQKEVLAAAGVPDLIAKLSEDDAIGLVFMAQRHSLDPTKKVPKYLQVVKVNESRNRTIKHLGSDGRHGGYRNVENPLC